MDEASVVNTPASRCQLAGSVMSPGQLAHYPLAWQQLIGWQGCDLVEHREVKIKWRIREKSINESK